MAPTHGSLQDKHTDGFFLYTHVGQCALSEAILVEHVHLIGTRVQLQ